MSPEYYAAAGQIKRYVRFYNEQKASRNEATTRLRLINVLLTDCLGWSLDDIIAEEAFNGKYTDYSLGSPRRLIVEAKREGVFLELPSQPMTRIEVPLQRLIRDNSDTEEAITQVATYCQQRGVPFAAVTNGHQLIAFIANRSDGKPPLEGKCLLFSSPEEMEVHFRDLWDATSKEGVHERRIVLRLAGDFLPALPPKLSAHIEHYPGIKSRNILQTQLQQVSELVLEDLPQTFEKEFSHECYCKSGALSQYSILSKNVLLNRYSELFEKDEPGPMTSPATTKSGLAPEILGDGLSRRPILLIGNVGAGKTEFIRNLRLEEAPEVFDNSITFYIDLGSQATLSKTITDFLPLELESQLKIKYGIDISEDGFLRATYHADLLRFANGPAKRLRETNPIAYAEKEFELIEAFTRAKLEHVKRSLGHLVTLQRKQVIIFLDNADQRSQDAQQQAFLNASEISGHWGATVFLSIRPETFHASARRGALTGYNTRAFTIAPPRIALVVEKRLVFALNLLEGRLTHASLSALAPQAEELAKFIRVFLRSLDYNDSLQVCLENISGGNVRQALIHVKQVFGSSHLDTDKILRKWERYTIPLHEFLRSIIFGNYEYYSPEGSDVTNIFDINFLDPKEHFLMPLILGYLGQEAKRAAADGFVESHMAYEFLQALAFTTEQIDFCIYRATSRGLIETTARRIPEKGQTIPHALRATSSGLYHSERLASYFTYIDAISVDTPILVPRYEQQIQDARGLEERLERASIFRKYLDEQWTHLASNSLPWTWDRHSRLLSSDMELVAASNARQRDNR
jgi:hypothetical protein